MAIAVEGESAAFDATQTTRPTIAFDSFNRQTRWIDIFNRGQTAFDFSISPEADWIKVSHSPGTVQTERRIRVAIDWDKAPSGAAKSSIRIAGAGSEISLNVNAFKPAEPSRDSVDGFVESEGCVSIEA